MFAEGLMTRCFHLRNAPNDTPVTDETDPFARTFCEPKIYPLKMSFISLAGMANEHL